MTRSRYRTLLGHCRVDPRLAADDSALAEVTPRHHDREPSAPSEPTGPGRRDQEAPTHLGEGDRDQR